MLADHQTATSRQTAGIGVRIDNRNCPVCGGSRVAMRLPGIDEIQLWCSRDCVPVEPARVRRPVQARHGSLHRPAPQRHARRGVHVSRRTVRGRRTHA